MGKGMGEEERMEGGEKGIKGMQERDKRGVVTSFDSLVNRSPPLKNSSTKYNLPSVWNATHNTDNDNTNNTDNDNTNT